MPILAYVLSVGSVLVGGLLLLSYALGPPVDSSLIRPRKHVAAVSQQNTPKQTPVPPISPSKTFSVEDTVGLSTTASPATTADAQLAMDPIVRSEPENNERVPLPTPRPPVDERAGVNQSVAHTVLKRSTPTRAKQLPNVRGGAATPRQGAEFRPHASSRDAVRRKQFSPFEAFASGPKHGW
jgi:hypothetical protein